LISSTFVTFPVKTTGLVEIAWDTTRPNGQSRRSLDASRADELFGFRSRVPLRDGIARTVAWYRSTA
jgi:nucleoside-diphosphate-sugar epimerase